MFKRNAVLYEIGCVVSFNPYTLRAVRRLDEKIPIMLTHKNEVLSLSLAKRKARRHLLPTPCLAPRSRVRLSVCSHCRSDCQELRLPLALSGMQASWWKVWLAGKADRMLANAIRNDLWMSLKARGAVLYVAFCMRWLPMPRQAPHLVVQYGRRS